MSIVAGLKQAPSKRQVILVIGWLSFLMAGIATGVFFSIVDPISLSDCVRLPEVSRTTAYSVGFFLFWLLTFVSSFISHSFLTTDK